MLLYEGIQGKGALSNKYGPKSKSDIQDPSIWDVIEQQRAQIIKDTGVNVKQKHYRTFLRQYGDVVQFPIPFDVPKPSKVILYTFWNWVPVKLKPVNNAGTLNAEKHQSFTLDVQLDFQEKTIISAVEMQLRSILHTRKGLPDGEISFGFKGQSADAEELIRGILAHEEHSQGEWEQLQDMKWWDDPNIFFADKDKSGYRRLAKALKMKSKSARDAIKAARQRISYFNRASGKSHDSLTITTSRSAPAFKNKKTTQSNDIVNVTTFSKVKKQ